MMMNRLLLTLAALAMVLADPVIAAENHSATPTRRSTSLSAT